jgi:hypothetical protein
LIRSRSERDTAREEAAAAAKDVISLRALLQVAQLRQTERENASKEILVDSFEVERGRLAASLSDKVNASWGRSFISCHLAASRSLSSHSPSVCSLFRLPNAAV